MTIPRDIRINAVVDYLLGEPTFGIVLKHGITVRTLTRYVRKAGFKPRRANEKVQRLRPPWNQSFNRRVLTPSPTGASAMDLLIWFAVACIVVIVLYYLLTQLPLPEPAGRIITIVIVVVVAVIAIGFLMQFAGDAHWRWRG